MSVEISRLDVRHLNQQKKKRSWSAREKLMIIAYYEKGHSKHSTAEEFQIETKQLRDWISKKSKLMKAAPYIQKLSVGAKAKYPELEIELMKWFEELRSQQKTVSRYMIQAKARLFVLLLVLKKNMEGLKITNFHI